MTEVERATGSLYGLWRDTPSGFVEDVLGESLWSKQRAVLDAIVDHKRVAVPAGFGVGKTHLAARAAVWFTNVYPVGTALCITTATRFRQVQRQLWPHIRKVVPRAGLPGYCDTVQYKMPDPYGNDFVAAYGFSAPANDEAAMQGIHMPHLLLIVDEAGGIAPMIGHGTNNLLTGGHAAMLAIGNPAMDDPASWFEELCIEGDDVSEPTTVTIPISSLDSPAITGELAPYCTDCPSGVARHSLADHMPDQDWVDRTIRSYGEHHPYVIAKVYARFPKGGGGIVVPPSWVEAAMSYEDPTGDGWHRLCDLGLEGETAQHTVREGAWVRLGVDVAADGGDEFTVYRSVGDTVEFRHASAGAANDNQVSVAEKVLEEIHAAQSLADALNSPTPCASRSTRTASATAWCPCSNGGRRPAGTARRSSASWCRSPRARTTPAPSCGRGASATRCGWPPGRCSSPTRHPAAGGCASTSTRRPPRSSPRRSCCPRRADTPRSSPRRP
ncbi:hypothetical protein [Streptomyces sirii]|uniref:hypothetical protein n=1 Tax=Streptomyces sirii TaxID=3127701 RepID=UPI003D364F5C